MTEETGISLSSFILSLATQAMMQLGIVPPPPGIPVSVDRPQAKQTIDLLSLLRDKMKGNLTQEEESLFEEVMHNLRMAYLQPVK